MIRNEDLAKSLGHLPLKDGFPVPGKSCGAQAQAQEATCPAVAHHLRAQISELQGRRPVRWTGHMVMVRIL